MTTKSRIVWCIVIGAEGALLALVLLLKGRVESQSADLNNTIAQATRRSRSLPTTSGQFAFSPTTAPAAAPQQGTIGAKHERPAAIVQLPPEPRPSTRLRSLSLVDKRYAAFFATLKSSPELIHRMRDELVEEPFRTSDAAKQSHAAGETREQTLSRMQAVSAETESRIREILGDEQFARFMQYKQSLPLRPELARVQARLSYSDDPLTPAQFERIAEAALRAGGLAAIAADPGPLSRELTPRQQAAIIDIAEEIEAAKQASEIAARSKSGAR